MIGKTTCSISVPAILLSLLLGLGCHGQNGTIGTTAAQYENLDGKNFKEKYQASKNAVLLDVRTPEEVAQGSIEGFINIDFYKPDFHQRLDSLAPDKEYFIYCRSGRRSSETCKYLSKKGYKTYNLDGGFDAWNKAK